jgi:hypothetical protein
MSDEINLDLLKLLDVSREKLLKNGKTISKNISQIDRSREQTINLLTKWYNQIDMEIFELNQLKPTEEIEKSKNYKLELKKGIEEKIKNINT